MTNQSNLRKMPEVTKNHRVKELGSSYFTGNYSSAEDRMKTVRQEAYEIPEPYLYGIFHDSNEYLKTLKLLMLSSLEPTHKEEVFSKDILHRLKSYNNLLDVGAGSGEFTQIIGKHFNNITVVDNSQEAMENIPNVINNKTVHKIHGSILDENIDIFQVRYDLILLSHILYYIPKDKILPLIAKLHNLLNFGGVIVVAINEEGDRAALVKHFGSNDSGFSNLEYELPKIYNKFELYRIHEFLDGGDIDSTMKIAGLCLNDHKVNATKEALYEYSANHLCHDGVCQISMVQNIMVIGESSFDD